MKPTLNLAVKGLIALCLLLPLPRMANAQAVTAVARLDLTQLSGAWFVIARFPIKSQKQCIGGEVVLFAPGDKPRSFKQVTSCLIRNGNSDAWNAQGSVGKDTDGKLKLRTFWPFSKPYWVLAVGPGCKWALAGTPNRKSLWVLSRAPTLDPDALAQIQAKAAAEGFPTSKLVMIPRHP